MNLPAATIPDAITVISPVIVATLAGWLGQVKWPAWANALVAGVLIVAMALICVLITGATLTSNYVEDFLIIAAYIGALTYGPFSPLHGLQKYLLVSGVLNPPASPAATPPAPAPVLPTAPLPFSPPTSEPLPKSSRTTGSSGKDPA
jgi:hypothetical protein